MESRASNIEIGQKTLRSPVVSVMGHIDHGKSTLLDYIRKTNIVAKEAGGITQHIGAYEVVHKNQEGKDKKITFLDTPGHAAFAGIRSRSANVADIAILVVSAEEGVKPQTTEALKYIRSAKLPFIVAITKIDKPEANIEKAKQTLMEQEVYVEGYGGDVPSVPVSSKTGEGIPELLEMILLVAELQGFTADTDKPAEGFVIEAKVDKAKGIIATLIIKNGALEKGMAIVSGESISSVRIMENALGKNIDRAESGSPVRIVGWNTIPVVGTPFSAFKTKKEAEAKLALAKEKHTKPKKLTDKVKDVPEGEVPPTILPIIIKADALGSVDDYPRD